MHLYATNILLYKIFINKCGMYFLIWKFNIVTLKSDFSTPPPPWDPPTFEKISESVYEYSFTKAA